MSSNLTEPEGKPEPQAWIVLVAWDLFGLGAISPEWGTNHSVKDLARYLELSLAKHYSSSISFRDGWDARGEAAKKLAAASVLPEPSSDFHEGWNAATEMLKADIRALRPPTEKKGKE